MKVITLCFLSFVLFTFGTCSKDPAKPVSDCGKAAKLDSDLYTDGPNDQMSIDTVWMTDGCVSISYRYGGGCGETDLQLVGTHDPTEQWPSSVSSRFSFKDRDNCKAYIFTTESFDLAPFQKEGTNTLDIKIDGWDQVFRYEY